MTSMRGGTVGKFWSGRGGKRCPVSRICAHRTVRVPEMFPATPGRAGWRKKALERLPDSAIDWRYRGGVRKQPTSATRRRDGSTRVKMRGASAASLDRAAEVASDCQWQNQIETVMMMMSDEWNLARSKQAWLAPS